MVLRLSSMPARRTAPMLRSVTLGSQRRSRLLECKRLWYHVGDSHQRPQPSVAMFVPTITADQIPRWMADNDHRGRVVELRELCKQWAHTDHRHRAAMVAQAPRRHRWWHRFSRRRHDLTRIAAVVHALCDRDGVSVPAWVWQHRSRRPIGVLASLDPNSKWGRAALADAPDACAYHDVWFDQSMIENITAHGFGD